MISVIGMLACSGSGTDSGTDTTEDPERRVQGFVEIYGQAASINDDRVGAIHLLDGGDVLLGVEMAVPDATDMLMLRMEPDGTEVWRTLFGGEFDEEVHHVVASSTWAWFAGARWGGDGVTDADERAIVVQTDLATGQVVDGVEAWEWNATGGRDAATSILAEGEELVITGWADDNLLVARVESDLSPIVRREWDRGEREEGEAAVVVGDRVFVAGRTKDPADEDDTGQLFVAAIELGDLRISWAYEWGERFQLTERAHDLVAAGDTLVVAGSTEDGRGVMLGLDLDGNLLWDRTYNEGSTNAALAVELDPAGRAVVAMDVDDELRLLWIDPATGETVDEATWRGNADITITELAISDALVCVGGTIAAPTAGLDALASCFQRDPLRIPGPPG
ncbi:MAG: hypothetical protein KTR31_08555 [Myxococcales bacterium]|nr:hypothetical protein [Myxococcales bacterium]